MRHVNGAILAICSFRPFCCARHVFLFYYLTPYEQRGGGNTLSDFFFFFPFPCLANHERDWPLRKVVFSGWQPIR